MRLAEQKSLSYKILWIKEETLMIQWRFPSNDHGENRGINDSGVATFRGTPLKSLAREI